MESFAESTDLSVTQRFAPLFVAGKRPFIEITYKPMYRVCLLLKVRSSMYRFTSTLYTDARFQIDH